MLTSEKFSSQAENAYELAIPAQIKAVLASDPVAYIPIGCLEYHGPHLPLGVDMLTADALCHRTASKTGGLVLPPLTVASGVLPLPYSITYPTDILRAVIRPILEKLAEEGFKAIVVFSGHGPFDHLHVLREECDQLMQMQPEVRAKATVWNELTVDLEGDIHDHGAKVETSYMMELWPDTVHLEKLDDDPAAEHVGVYAANPRFTASREWGKTLSDVVVGHLADAVRRMIDGEPVDNWEEARRLVTRLQAGDLEIVESSGRLTDEGMIIVLHNPHPQSKYITAVNVAELDEQPLSLVSAWLRNCSIGEGHTDQTIDKLGPLSGFYIRRGQQMEIILPNAKPLPGHHEVRFEFVLADVLPLGASGRVVLKGAS